eukprot:TRINITY_DN110735_c0_g1_i1.p1 TRINITY_DN110735_c0_g1~~TRINITY_DN110735_c0_g1_i1.p1  ORF type:complete len:681 (-),score=107.46 TRINITY_DN110735_c0_g1_i1:74-2116(-)
MHILAQMPLPALVTAMAPKRALPSGGEEEERPSKRARTYQDAEVLISDVSDKLQSALMSVIKTAIAAAPVESLQIPSVEEEARILLRTHDGKSADAIEAVSELTGGSAWGRVFQEFLKQLPFCSSAVQLEHLWRTIRRVALIARLNGHDLQSNDTLTLIFICLIPAGGSNMNGQHAQGGSSSALSPGGLARNWGDVAVAAAGVLGKEAVKRFTVVPYAVKTVDLVVAAAKALKTYAPDPPPDASVALRAEATSLQTALLAIQPPAGSQKDARPTPEKLATTIFRPPSWDEKPSTLLMHLVLWLLPPFMSIVRSLVRALVRLQGKTALVNFGILGVLAVVIGAIVWVQRRLEQGDLLTLPATLVFVIHSSIPGLSAFLATQTILWGLVEAPFFCLLGFFNLIGAYLAWSAARDVRSAQREAGHRALVKQVRQGLGAVLILGFVMEEVLGRVLGLHSLSLFGPPQAKSDATLLEFRTVAFSIGLVAAWSQEKLLTALKKKRVLLRVLGPRNVIYGAVSFIFHGVFAVVYKSEAMQFLKERSPSPWWCCAILWLRRWSAPVGLSLALVSCTISLGLRGVIAKDQFFTSMIVSGCVLYGFADRLIGSFRELRRENQDELNSDGRMLLLFPQMSAQARAKAFAAMTSARQATKKVLQEWVAMRVSRLLFQTAADSFANRAPAPPG